jgi:hypothetical protein
MALVGNFGIVYAMQYYDPDVPSFQVRGEEKGKRREGRGRIGKKKKKIERRKDKRHLSIRSPLRPSHAKH